MAIRRVRPVNAPTRLRNHTASSLPGWNTLIDQPWKIMSIAQAFGQSSVTHCDVWYETQSHQFKH
jgi:hypothetical protein